MMTAREIIEKSRKLDFSANKLNEYFFLKKFRYRDR